VTTLILLLNGYHDGAAMVLFPYMHAINFSASYYRDYHMSAALAIMVFTHFSFFLAVPSKFRIISGFFCAAEFTYYILKILKLFEVTLTSEQTYQIFSFVAAATACYGALWVGCIIQKSIETNLWQMAHLNSQKSENLTREVVQAAAAKDTFISSLSHEIRNPLNSLSGSIDYLLGEVKDPIQQRLLNSAKLSCEVLLNLVNNVLDAAKLRHEKMELSYLETNFLDTIKKVLMINTEKMKERKIFAEAYISSSFPRLIWTDPSRLLQIIMNIFGNALKFSHDNSKIKLYITWCPSSLKTDKSTLLLPLDPLKNNEFIGDAEELANDLSSMEELKATRTESHVFREFTLEETENRIKNLNSIKPFKSKGFADIKNKSCLNHRDSKLEPEIQPWTIRRSLGKNRTAPPLSSPTFNISPYEEKLNKMKGFLKVQITDSGCGIPAESIPKLFSMFNQADNRVASIHGGTGLGLWICKQLCQKMGGDIAIYSQVNKGTTVVFYIPVNNDYLIDDSPLGVNNDFKDEVVKALVVDDYAFNRNLHRLLLEQEGIHVTLASDGQEAVEKYKAEDGFDFIMMDVKMPEMDGFVAAKKIREWEALRKEKKVDIYFVSGEYFNEDEVMTGFRTKGGASEVIGIRCLRKPVDIDIIQKLAEKYKMNSSIEKNVTRNKMKNENEMEITYRKRRTST